MRTIVLTCVLVLAACGDAAPGDRATDASSDGWRCSVAPPTIPAATTAPVDVLFDALLTPDDVGDAVPIAMWSTGDGLIAFSRTAVHQVSPTGVDVATPYSTDEAAQIVLERQSAARRLVGRRKVDHRDVRRAVGRGSSDADEQGRSGLLEQELLHERCFVGRKPAYEGGTQHLSRSRSRRRPGARWLAVVTVREPVQNANCIYDHVGCPGTHRHVVVVDQPERRFQHFLLAIEARMPRQQREPAQCIHALVRQEVSLECAGDRIERLVPSLLQRERDIRGRILELDRDANRFTEAWIDHGSSGSSG